jgi:hypothetical protein
MASSPTTGVTLEITTGAANVLSEIIFAENQRSFVVQFRTNAGKVLLSGGTDAGALGTIDYIGQPAETCTTYPVPGTMGMVRNLDSTTRKAWITSATGSTVAEITALADPYTSAG